MSAEDSLLFIDANKYLDLYRTNSGKILLGPLVEQADNIFVTQQVANEVQRNKVSVITEFLTNQLKDLKIPTFNVPDHLSGPEGVKILSLMKTLKRLVDEVNSDVDSMMRRIMEDVSLSKDDVSVALSRIFARAVPHTDQELKRARTRRELGNPPGKSQNAIGDQLNWEQILTHFRGKKSLWIISRDGDYGTAIGGKVFLNQFLWNELRTVNASADVFLFQDTPSGIQHFVKKTGVKAERQLSPEQIEEIAKEEKSLPDLPVEPLLDPIGNVRNSVKQLANLLSRYPMLDAIREKSAIDNIRAQQAAIEAMSGQKFAMDAIREQKSAIETIKVQQAAIEAMSGQKFAMDAIREQKAAIETIKVQQAAIEAMSGQKFAMDAIREQKSAIEALETQQAAIDKHGN